MQYISFYKDRLPFKPKSNVVIYFDVMGVGRKFYYEVINEYCLKKAIAEEDYFADNDEQSI